MPKGQKTHLFISSTCYDLSQVRVDLQGFCHSMALEPVMSEMDTFPVNPSKRNVDNCLEAVRNRADIFVLIVGGRFGTATESGRSITNLEYAEACAKGIPKYVFVQRTVHTLLRTWRDNPDGDYSATVDTSKVFEFISELCESGNTWVYPIDAAQDITRILTSQLSFLLSDCLDLRLRFQENDEAHSLLSAAALRLAVEKERGWEYLLFAQILADQVTSYQDKKFDVELGIGRGKPIILESKAAMVEWMSDQLAWLSHNARVVEQTFERGWILAIGEAGEPSDLRRMHHLASRIGEIYEQFLDWTIDCRRASAGDEYARLISLLADLSQTPINDIEEFASSLLPRIRELIQNADLDGPERREVITLTINPSPSDAFHQELNRFT